MSTLSTTSAAAVGDLSAFETMRRNVINPPARDELKHRLIGSYVVSGTDPDGKPYAGGGIVDIALAPSGALELDWDNGKQVGARRQVVAPYGSGPEGHRDVDEGIGQTHCDTSIHRPVVLGLATPRRGRSQGERAQHATVSIGCALGLWGEPRHRPRRRCNPAMIYFCVGRSKSARVGRQWAGGA
jgi:hypothetical protein